MGLVSGRHLENRCIDFYKGLRRKKSPRGFNHPGAAYEERPPVAVYMRLPPGRSIGRGRAHWCHFAGNAARKGLRLLGANRGAHSPANALAKSRNMAIVPPGVDGQAPTPLPRALR